MKQHNASVLVVLLWCLALLSVVVIGVLHTATMDLRVGKNQSDSIQAYYLALAGVEKAKALLYLDAADRRRSGRNHSGELYNSQKDFHDIRLGRGTYSVLRTGDAAEGGQVVYGVSDEESRLSLNSASVEELMKLEGMTPEVAAAVVDYRDSDENTSPNGAEREYYASLNPPYIPRDAPIQTPREVMLVRGVRRDLYQGEDANLNGLLDPEEDDGNASAPPDNQDGILDAGWSGITGIFSSVQNLNAYGRERVNVKTADENALTQVSGITSDIARAIVSSRGQNQLDSIADLLDVSAQAPGARPPQQNNNPGRPGQPQPPPPQQSSGPKVISEDLLLDIADAVTASDDREQNGAVNVNTASALVLQCLPGMTPELAQAIVSYRQSSGFLANTAWLLRVPGMTRQIFKGLSSRVTARSETFRILSEGRVGSGGAVRRIQVIVRVGSSSVDTLSYREDL